ncbi:MAG TPA: hypothetical protein V6C89_14450 [Drouetiella sp.]
MKTLKLKTFKFRTFSLESFRSKSVSLKNISVALMLFSTLPAVEILFYGSVVLAADKEAPLSNPAKRQLSLTDFSSFKKGMDTQSLLSRCGKPERDLGSGIHIYEYLLADKTKVWVGCVDTIMYIDHVAGGKHKRIVGEQPSAK